MTESKEIEFRSTVEGLKSIEVITENVVDGTFVALLQESCARWMLRGTVRSEIP